MGSTKVRYRPAHRYASKNDRLTCAVSDVFHTGSPDALWEFKHGQGNFKRGDLVGLREIKRRASRHALVHREYNNQKPAPSQPSTPAENVPPAPDGADPRLASIEQTLYEVSSRLQRSEENAHYMQVKHQTMMDTVSRLLHFNQELSRTVLSLIPNPENPIHRDGALFFENFESIWAQADTCV